MNIIAGLYRHRRLKTPKGDQTRPTSNRLRESLFNICQSVIPDCHFLDIFAGSGAMGLEALSRGAQTATFIESNREALRCIDHNIDALGVKGQCRVMRGDVFSMLQLLDKQKMKFDVIYADPPYLTSPPNSPLYYSSAIVEWIDQHAMLNANGLLFVEEEFLPTLPPPQLKSLTLVDSRRMGHTMLLKFKI